MTEEMKQVLEELEKGVQEVFTSGRYEAYLKTLSKFHNYSFNNTLLIFMQKPDASRVAGFNTWKKEFSRYVKKGEKAIRILAPIPHKVKDVDEDGNEIERQWLSFRQVSVFDISQTDGKPLESLTEDLSSDLSNYEELRDRIASVSPVPIEYRKLQPGLYGYYSLAEKKIVIDETQSKADALSTMIHEISHALIHEPESEFYTQADNSTREVQAESIAFVVASHYGLDTSKYSFGYIAAWSTGKELKELTASMEVIRQTAEKFIA